VRFAFVAAEKADFPIATMCRVLRVSRSGFYAWRGRPVSGRTQEDARLRRLVREAHERGRRYYGSPRVHRELAEGGTRVSRKRVIRLMQAEGLVARPRTRFKTTTNSDHAQPVADNLLQRDFTATRPNQRWVGDTSEFRIGTGTKVFVATILDLYSRFAVGWAISAVNDRHLTLKALEMAIKRRCPEVGLLHHSDRGSTYASEDYQRRLQQHGITCSMSRRGDCYDNAVMEAFFSTVKSELGDRFISFAEAKAQLFDYLEVFYNQQRRHSTIGLISPAAYERDAAATGVDAAVPVDAKNAATRDLENRNERGFPQRPPPYFLSVTETADALRGSLPV